MTIDLGAEGKGSTVLAIPYSSHESAYGQLEIMVGHVKNGNGPTILLVAGNHGDEYEGQFALRNLFRTIDPRQVRGRILIIPAANPPAVYASSRLSPLDNGNLNRSFPGAPHGGPTAAIAYAITNEVLPGVDYLIDLHSGGSSLEYLPCTIVQRTDDAEVDRVQANMARAFGAPRMLVYDHLPGIATSLSGAAISHKILCIATELGGGGICTPATLKVAEQGLASILVHLGALEGDPAHRLSERFRVNTSADFLRAPDNGFFEPLAALGDRVKKGQLAGYIHRFAELNEEPLAVHFPADGEIVCKRTFTRSSRGDCLFHTARSEAWTD